MNIFKKIIIVLSVAIAAILLDGCLEEVIPPPVTGELNLTAEIMGYIEQQGDFANSGLAPALVTAQEVFDNLNNYLILDLRTHDEFLTGHIVNSINVTNDSLYEYITDYYNSGYTKIVLVSKNGQSSAYFASLLRLAGFDKIYTLKYGMASWHIDFADEWLSAVGNSSEYIFFTNDESPKNDITDLPIISVENPNASIGEIVESRIKKLIREGFTRGNTYRENLDNITGTYLVCYGENRLYYQPITEGGFGHPPGAIWYKDSPYFDFRSINSLQTLPSNSDIIIYSYNGQLSACMTAYLKILGYKVKTYLFGANSLIYSRMITNVGFVGYVFTLNDIMNFDYVVGN